MIRRSQFQPTPTSLVVLSFAASLFSLIRFASSSSSLSTSNSTPQISGLDPPFTPIHKDERTTNKSGRGDKSEYFRVCCRGCNQQLFDATVILKGNPGWPTFHSVAPFDQHQQQENSSEAESIRLLSSVNPSTLTRDVLNLVVDDLNTIAEEHHDYLLLLKEKTNKEGGKTEFSVVKREMEMDQEENELDDDDDNIPLTKEEELLAQLVANGSAGMMIKKRQQTRQHHHQQSSSSSSLKLRSSPPNMRWGITAVRPTEYNHEIMDQRTERELIAEKRRREKKKYRGKVKASVEVKHVKDIRTSPGVCRCLCQNCDTFIGFVFSNEMKSPTKQRFVCNPSSLVFRD